MLPKFGWGIPSGSPTDFWAWQTVWAVRLRQSISADLGSIHVDGSWVLERRLTLRVLGCRTDFGSSCPLLKQNTPPPEFSPFAVPPLRGQLRPWHSWLTAPVVRWSQRPTCSVLVSYTPDLLTFRADRERYYTPPTTCSSVTST